ncbi:MAG: epoxyqueuosine reductase [Thermanaeromonas sp.]|uniref:hypothetical protein n=1 Tax=Thermanaeromonas sp. TaxID=2003697 RepID=UPI0024406D87|nr:hypothetical protein [Thermanaeromonas sp.]MCG0278768.1 epoxyqueuosine reductase [Thermanaeromonas sp.]
MLKRWLKEEIHSASTFTRYREPLVGFASARDPLFLRLKEVVGQNHLSPSELLPSAQTILVFFLPFTPELVFQNQKGDWPAKEWALAYVETNQLIKRICERLQRELSFLGIRSAFAPPTHNFDRVTLTSGWSHKHVAYIAGLGRFGAHHMLITRQGCAGRLGSLVIEAFIPPTPRPTDEHCLWLKEGQCGICFKSCPVQALSSEGLDKKRCYQWLLKVAEAYADLGLCDVCGKCATGPCAASLPRY